MRRGGGCVTGCVTGGGGGVTEGRCDGGDDATDCVLQLIGSPAHDYASLVGLVDGFGGVFLCQPRSTLPGRPHKHHE